MWLIVYNLGLKGWCVVEAEDFHVRSGPYATHAQAVEAAETAAYRIAQGWAP